MRLRNRDETPQVAALAAVADGGPNLDRATAREGAPERAMLDTLRAVPEARPARGVAEGVLDRDVELITHRETQLRAAHAGGILRTAEFLHRTTVDLHRQGDGIEGDESATLSIHRPRADGRERHGLANSIDAIAARAVVRGGALLAVRAIAAAREAAIDVGLETVLDAVLTGGGLANAVLANAVPAIERDGAVLARIAADTLAAAVDVGLVAVLQTVVALRIRRLGQVGTATDHREVTAVARRFTQVVGARVAIVTIDGLGALRLRSEVEGRRHVERRREIRTATDDTVVETRGVHDAQIGRAWVSVVAIGLLHALRLRSEIERRREVGQVGGAADDRLVDARADTVLDRAQIDRARVVVVALRARLAGDREVRDRRRRGIRHVTEIRCRADVDVRLHAATTDRTNHHHCEQNTTNLPHFTTSAPRRAL